MRRILSIILSLSLISASLTFLVSSATAAEPVNQFNITVDAAIEGQIKAFAEIKAMFDTKDPAPVLADIKAKYIEKFQAGAKALDVFIKAGDPKIDETIIATLDLAIEGKLNLGQAKQAIDKGLQWYFYFLIKDIINKKAKPAMESGDTATAKVELEKAIQIYAGVLQATAAKRDSKFKTTTQDLLDTVVIPALQADVTKKDVLGFNLHRQMLDKTLIKVFILATLTYAETIPTKPVADQPAAVTEGYFFYMSVYSYLKGGSAVDADYIKNAYGSGDPSKINLEAIKLAVTRAIIGKVSEYGNAAIAKMAAGDLPAAQVYAMEGNMFVAAGETFIKEKYGELAYTLATAQGTQFLETVAAGDITAAKLQVFGTVKLISGINGVNFKINSKTLTVNGVPQTVEELAYITPATSRTLVSAKFLSESLGAEVKWIAASRTVVISKDGVIAELAVGSTTVKQNGQVFEGLTLDQPVVIKNQRSFIPLKAVADLLGFKVFYNNGEIVIVK
ncbi:MAG TPA: copper amine oxidase N-terminal domain-containing protein [Bacilli bacterium]